MNGSHMMPDGKMMPDMPKAGMKMRVKGKAIVAGVSRNNIKYVDEELFKGSNSLNGVTILKDHEALTDNSVGKVEAQTYVDKTQFFEGWVEEDGTNLLQKIKDKRVKVSVGAIVEKLVKEDEDSDVMTAKGIRYMELSLTPTPGVPDACIEAGEGVVSDVTESFDLKQLKSKLSEDEINEVLCSESIKEIIQGDANGGEEILSENKECSQEKNEERTEASTEREEGAGMQSVTNDKPESVTVEAVTETVEAVAEVKQETVEATPEVKTEIVNDATPELLDKEQERASPAKCSPQNVEVVQENPIKNKQEGECKKMTEVKEDFKSQNDVEESVKKFEGYVLEKDNGKNVFYKKSVRGD